MTIPPSITRMRFLLVAAIVVTSTVQECCHSLTLSSFSYFHGARLIHGDSSKVDNGSSTTPRYYGASDGMTMRKQKASDRRTRRMQRGSEALAQELIRDNLLRDSVTKSPMASMGPWNQKRGDVPNQQNMALKERTGGRGRSRKRSILYTSLSSYHNKFLQLLTAEYLAEEQEVTGRIKNSIEDPLALEVAGHALYDMYPERRGNLFSDEIYRLVKAKDATTSVVSDNVDTGSTNGLLPPNSKFSNNDVIMVTVQPLGSGDFFDPQNLPTSSSAVTAEARVVATGPTYIDIAMPAGSFEANFGPAPNNQGPSGKGDPFLRLRVDRFFSNVPYNRMVEALTRISSIPEREAEPKPDAVDSLHVDTSRDEGNSKKKSKSNDASNSKSNDNSSSPHSRICMDDVLREAIISTHAFTDPSTPLFHEPDACDLQTLSRQLSQPPMQSSVKLANQVLTYVQSNPRVFKSLNGPQLAAIGAALTRKMTLIQGPPGTGKTSTASVIGFGFTHQCRSISSNSKVLACAFSNVGADNLAEGFLRLGLKVVRVGKASAVSSNLWDYTLDAAIDRDPEAQKALTNAARATAKLMKIRKDRKRKTANGMVNERAAQEIATAAVKQSIKMCNIAATRALREVDIVVSTSTGAADPRLMAACGLGLDIDDLIEEDGRVSKSSNRDLKSVQRTAATAIEPQERTNAPDGLPPLSLPFVIIDEACQSVEPGTLIPLTASNSCRSLVLLGDPCQLPATVKSDPDSPLSISLMERLAATLPAPMIKMKDETTEVESRFVDALPIKQAKSLIRSGDRRGESNISYRKRFSGSLLLAIQYRMHPSIAAFPSSIFYDGLLATPSFLGSDRPFPQVLNHLMPCGDPSIGVRMINVGGRCNEMKGGANKFTRTSFSPTTTTTGEESTTFRNEAEAVRVISLIKQILSFDIQYDPNGCKSIGVITPYTGQVQLIRSMLANDADIVSLVESLSTTIEVNSVDGYQGRERDVIIFSAVRSNRRGALGFLTDWRRLNVALTRAKTALLVVGDIETLSQGDKHWASFVKWCDGVRCIIDDTESGDECVSI